MDIGTAATVSAGMFSLVSLAALVISKFAPKRNGVKFCSEHEEMKEDVRIARVILLRLAKHSGIDVSEFEDLVR